MNRRKSALGLCNTEREHEIWRLVKIAFDSSECCSLLLGWNEINQIICFQIYDCLFIEMSWLHVFETSLSNTRIIAAMYAMLCIVSQHLLIHASLLPMILRGYSLLHTTCPLFPSSHLLIPSSYASAVTPSIRCPYPHAAKTPSDVVQIRISSYHQSSTYSSPSSSTL